MLKVFATDVIVSKGYENQSAVRFSEDGNTVRFRIGKKVYDKNAENNTRWFNVSVKGFGPVVERIKKMQLKEGSLIHISGKLDEESWTDQNNVTKTQTVIILEDIDYASGGGKKEGQAQQNGSATPATPVAGANNAPENSPNFEGYSNFGGGSFFDGNI